MDEQPAIHQVASRNDSTGDEFDSFCESCGYNLRGLTENRCPECGRDFDPNAVPSPRIPWLNRKQIGFIRSYRQTVWMILLSPKRFALEMRRPVRISQQDAARFALWSVRFAVIGVLTFDLIAHAVSIFNGLNNSGSGFLGNLIRVLSPNLILGFGCWLFLMLVIEIPLVPVYVRHGGLARLQALQQYSAASMILVPLSTAIFAVESYSVAIPRLADALRFSGTLLICFFVFQSWFIRLLFLRIVTACSIWQILRSAAFLIASWFFCAMGMLFCLAVAQTIRR